MTCIACSQPLNDCPCPDMVVQGLIPHSHSPRVAPRAGAGDTPPVASPTTVTAPADFKPDLTSRECATTRGSAKNKHRHQKEQGLRGVSGRHIYGPNGGEAGQKSKVAHATADSAQTVHAATRLTTKAHNNALKSQKILQRTINHSSEVSV